MEVVAEQVRADLKLEKVPPNEHHREQKHDGRNRHEKISNDEAIPQRPHSLRADKQNQPHEKISGGGNTEKDHQGSERERTAGGAVDGQHQPAYDEERRRDPVEQRHVPEPDGEAAR